MIRSIPHPIEILYGGGVGLSCGMDGSILAEETHGLFASDTRVLSSYRFLIAGHAWRLLARSRPGPSTAQWDAQNPAIRAPGRELPEGVIHCRIRRRVMRALHDDISVTSFADTPVAVRLGLRLDADFSDLFQVKDRSMPPRLSVQRVPGKSEISFVYEQRGFRRALHVSLACAAAPTFVGSEALFDVVLEPARPWTCCVEAVPEVDGKRLKFGGDPHAPEPVSPSRQSPSIECDARLADAFRRGAIDLDRLAISDAAHAPYIAAGAPWFLALFGRDTLVTSLMAGLLGSWHVRGALEALGNSQARERDDYRDAEPGKLAHELRHGELARFGKIPHTPYYGTHDAPALYVLALWNAFRWTGDRELIERHMEVAEAALRWCDEQGDCDGDGLLEYRTRSKKGYRNQGWKDAGDAIVHQDGSLAELPIATVELQGYWYAARLAMAELFDALGNKQRSAELRHAAEELRELVEQRFWMAEIGCYALALDGQKRRVESVSSNPGHLLWCGLPRPERARRVAARLIERDMFSGYGLRTLSAKHRSYNPLSYQCGSVWPHDNALFAAGLARYGLLEQASLVLKGTLDAAVVFEANRLPELFCGFERSEGPPVPYDKANVPQAWAAAAPLLAAQLLLGLVPDVPNRRCHLWPWLPEWLPSLELRGVPIGGAELHVRLRRSGTTAEVEYAEHPELEIVVDQPAAPLWGRPMFDQTEA